MGTPSSDATPTVEEQINTILSNVTTDDKGNTVWPEDIDPVLLHAARTEKRFRDTQGSYTRSQQELKTLKAENEALAASWEKDAVSNLSATEQARLEELKATDPDTWREEITKIERDKQEKFKDKRLSVSKEAKQQTELELREAELALYNEQNPEYALTDDVIENDIPPRLTRKLEKGEITFSEFLTECKTYLSTGKVIQKETKPEDPDFNGAPGTNKPSDKAIEGNLSDQYKTMTF